MQKRFIVGLFPTYLAASEAKNKELTGNPDNNYQVRRKYNGFALVHRVKTDEAEEVINRAQELYAKRPKRRSRKRVADFSA